jgi:hypothetical protein
MSATSDNEEETTYAYDEPMTNDAGLFLVATLTFFLGLFLGLWISSVFGG